jgi:hypothetical protein
MYPSIYEGKLLHENFSRKVEIRKYKITFPLLYT